jgi:heptosyltransferase-2
LPKKSRNSPSLCRNLCGATSLAQAVDLLALADLVVCNDSGLMHGRRARPANRRAVRLVVTRFTPPLSDQADILSLNLDCSPCFKRECPLGHLDCLNKLMPEQVFAACQKRIAR